MTSSSKNRPKPRRGERTNPCGDSIATPVRQPKKNAIAPLPLAVISFAPGGARARVGGRFPHGLGPRTAEGPPILMVDGSMEAVGYDLSPAWRAMLMGKQARNSS